MGLAGFDRDDPVFPDLAFSLEISEIDLLAETPPKSGRVGISPMVYCDPERWPVGNWEVHSRYLANLADVAERLIASNVEVVLISSDGPDKHTVKELERRIRQRVGGARLDKVHLPNTDTVNDFLRQAAGCEFVIASRLHGVILSHLVGTPVIALSYDRKVREHMNAIGQSGYCLNIDDFDADRLLGLVRTLRVNLANERASIRQKGKEFRSILGRQYDTVLQKGCGG
jgi:polysaccharide pyruvyl transferase WcaK-like protein